MVRISHDVLEDPMVVDSSHRGSPSFAIPWVCDGRFDVPEWLAGKETGSFESRFPP